MNSASVQKIIAIGGGHIGEPKEDGSGRYSLETTLIDKEIITLSGKKQPRLLFIPTASYDSKNYYERIKKNFLALGCSQVTPLYLSAGIAPSELQKTLLSHDIIYVGGGNTLRMMNIWKKHGVDDLLRQARAKGIVLCGLSAGSVCWFKYGNSDSRKFTSGTDKLIRVSGLNFIPALHCPHYDAEPHRQPDLKRMTKRTKEVAIALDNCAALEVVGKSYRILTSQRGAKAHKAYWKDGQYILTQIEKSQAFKPLDTLLSKS